MQKKITFICVATLWFLHTQPSATPYGLFEPYDINIKLRKPGPHHWYLGVLAEKSYNVKGYATDAYEEGTYLVNPMQIYEPVNNGVQNAVSMYQDNQATDSSFINLINNIAGGPGGGVSNMQNGLFVPTGKLCVGQAALSAIYGFKHHFYIGAYLPYYFTRLHSVHWKYQGDNTLFSGQELLDLAKTFQQDAQDLFDLHIGG